MSAEKKGYYTMRQVLEQSIAFENESARFYHDLRSKTKDSSALDLLSLLERQEHEHAASLERLLHKERLEGVFVQFPPELSLSMPDPPAGNPGYEALLDVAIAREITSAEIYEASAAAAPLVFNTLLESLAEFERIHERGLKELKGI